MEELVRGFLEQTITCGYASQLITLILLAGIAAVSVASYYVTKGLLWGLEKVILRSPTEWDDDLLNPRFMRAFSQLAPALIVSWLLPLFFADDEQSVRWINTLTSFYILWAVVRIVTILLDNLYEAFLKRDNLHAYAVKGIFQMVKLIIICIGVIVGISILFNKTPTTILTALGASAAVLSLVFKDTILGLVASVQLTANKMLRRGDWITVPNRDLNGEVLDVSLTTVKVRNWDNSVTTIPPYSLISESFKNYRPMQESGGRRVDRAIYIDINTVGFLPPSTLATLRQEGFLTTASPNPLLKEGATKPSDGEAKPSALSDLSEVSGLSELSAPRAAECELGSGEVLDPAATTVNLTLLRAHLERYLRSHRGVNQQMTLMVRQLEPTQAGLPLQLYFFTRTTEWVAYEHQMAEIMEYVYATVRRFGLRIFQAPAGSDLPKSL
jgi:miniconductance mechanosensitive channel